MKKREAAALVILPFSSLTHPIAQGPGPPQRPHIGLSGADVLLDPSEETAKTLSARVVWVESHLGQLIFSDEFIVRTSFSKLAPQDLH